MEQDQVNEFIDKAKNEVADVPDNQDAPRMPFPGGLRLTREQEDRMLDHAFNRLEELEHELGRNSTGGDDWFNSLDGENLKKACRTFLGKRHLYKMIYQNDVSWRPGYLGGIFATSNLVVPLARRIARQMVARATAYFLGSDPFFTLLGSGPANAGSLDGLLAKKLERYAHHKFLQGDITPELAGVIEGAFVKGEEVVKLRHRVDDDIYTSIEYHMVDEGGGVMIDSSGAPITDKDRWVPFEGDPSIYVLQRDPQIMRPETYRFAEVEVKKRNVYYEGPEVKAIHERDFLCPLTAPSIDEADCVVHLYDTPVMDLVDFYQRRDMLGTDAERRSATEKAIALINDLSAGRGTHSAEQQDGADLGDDDKRIPPATMTRPMSNIAEFHMRYDVNGDGIMENFMVIADRNTRAPIFYDYIAEATPDGRRPFRVNRVNPVKNRWYGLGALEMFESTQNISDLLVNRINAELGRSGRVDLWRPYNTVEGDFNPNLELNWGKTYTPKPGVMNEEVLSSIYLQQVNTAHLRELLEYFNQLAMNESGVMHANDNLVAGLNSASTATGINNIDTIGREMFSLYIDHLKVGMTKTVESALEILVKYIDREEYFVYLEGEVPVPEIITPEDVIDFRLNTRLLMTQERNQRILESNAQVIAMFEKFYRSGYTREQQERIAPAYRESLMAMQVTNSENVIVPDAPTREEMIQAEAAARVELEMHQSGGDSKPKPSDNNAKAA